MEHNDKSKTMFEPATELIYDTVAALRTNSLSVAVGNDIVHLPDFIPSCTPLFIRRVYTKDELAYCEQFDNKYLRYASTWAAKEAVYKLVKQVDASQKLWWRDIEIIRDKPQGKPIVSIKKMQHQPDISLTISHDGDYIWALAVCLSAK